MKRAALFCVAGLLCAGVVVAGGGASAATGNKSSRSVAELAGELRREVAIAQAERTDAQRNVARLNAEISDAYSWGMNEHKAKLTAQADLAKAREALRRRATLWFVLGVGVALLGLLVVRAAHSARLVVVEPRAPTAAISPPQKKPPGRKPATKRKKAL